MRLLGDLDPSGQMARMLIEIPNPWKKELSQSDLLLGSYVDVHIKGPELSQVFALPRRALRGNKDLFIAKEDNTLGIVSPSIAWSNSNSVRIYEGLAENTQVITSSLQVPVAGTPIRTDAAMAKNISAEKRGLSNEPINGTLNEKGPLAWMAKNKVAANLFMAIAIIAGLIYMRQIKQEVFPQVDLDMITVAVPYPGASPEEVEEGILLAIEEQVRGIDGVKTIKSTANENAGTVTLELKINADGDKVLNDVKSSVDRITSLPADSERPVISLLTSKSQAISLIVFGDIGPIVL